jgi:hypothetical protein
MLFDNTMTANGVSGGNQFMWNKKSNVAMARFLLMTLILVGPSWGAQPSTSRIADTGLERYIGKNAYEKVDGRTIYQTPGLREDFVSKYGSKRWKKLMSYTETAPIEAVSDTDIGRILAIWQCMPDTCTNDATVLLDPIAKVVVGVCFADTDSAKLVWIGPDWSREVPKKDGGKSCGFDAMKILASYKSARAAARNPQNTSLEKKPHAASSQGTGATAP